MFLRILENPNEIIKSIVWGSSTARKKILQAPLADCNPILIFQ